MIISSQDKRILTTKCKHFLINENNDILGIINENINFILGHYSSTEEAKKVLEQIFQAMICEDFYFVMPNSTKKQKRK